MELDRSGTPLPSPATALVVGFDRSAESHAALDVAIDLAQRLGGRLEIVYSAPGRRLPYGVATVQ